jgi:hypothetical protein
LYLHISINNSSKSAQKANYIINETMKKKLALIAFCSAIFLFQSVYSTDWPVLKKYDQEHTCKIALPVGGIGTGTVSLGGR